jgi:hypothetical protein
MYVQLMYYDFPPDIPITSIYLLPPTSTYNFGVDAWMIIEQAGTSGGWPYSDEVVSGATDPTPVAAKIADLVNSFLPPPVGGPPIKVEAQATGDTVKFWVSDMTGTYNGWRIKVTLGSIAIPQPNAGMITLSGGYVPPPDPDPPPPPEVPEVGDPLDMGTFVLAHNFRMWAVKDTLLNFSAPDNPGDWNDALTTGAGFIDMATITSRKPQLVSLADYRGDLAVFGRRHILIWHIDTLIESIYKRQTLHGTGTFAPHSVTPFGEGEVMYLDTSGIRSLRARDSSEAAYAADIGNMIDELVKAKVAASTEDQKYHNFWGVVEPRSGRLWMALYDKIFVLSYYPTSRIAAWTYYDATTRPVSMMNSSDDSIYWRSGNNVMVYGGTAGTTYDSTEALVRVPYIDGGKPATHKNWTGIDAAVYGTWAIRGSFDPMVPAALDLLATITKSTYAQQKIAVNGESPAVSLEFRTSFVGPAKLSNVSVHYTTSTED